VAVYFITGKLGSGKTLVTVGKIKDYLSAGKRVATNLDLNIDKLTARKSKATFSRLPDKPRPEDLELIGRGSDVVDESTYGLIVLDECGTWLNTRSYRDKERVSFIDWMLHARKLGWDIFFIIQDISVIDKQLRVSLCEHLVVCRRLDRLRISIVSKLVQFFTGVRLTMPKIHTAKVHYGESESDVVADRWNYQGKALYEAYDTRQIFKDDVAYIHDKEVDMRATYSSLSRWHLEGRYHNNRFNLPIPKNFIELAIYPTWLLILLARYVSTARARSSRAVL